MKYYPYILSEQRLSLLTPEERRQYDFEHSDYCDWAQKELALNKAAFNESYNMVKERCLNNLLEDENYENETEESLDEIAGQMAQFESEYVMNEVYDILKPIMTECVMTNEEYDGIIEYTKSVMLSNDSLNEATDGPDMTFWMKDLKAVLGISLIPLFSGMAYLLMAGKTKAAINALKTYMNKLVEEIDDGTYKKQSFFKKALNWITLKTIKKLKVKWFGGPKDIGANSQDKSHSSFRELQEVYEGNIACKQMVFMKNIGLLPDNYDKALKSIENNTFNAGGFNVFLTNIAEPLSKLCIM